MQSRKFFSLILEFVVILFCLSGLTSKTIAIDDHDLYVANDLSQCSGLPQPICFFNDEADTPQSVALNKAMNYVRNHPEGGSYQIHILSPYEIKTASVTIDRPVVLIGEDSGWFSTSSKSCLEPLLLITSGVTIRNLHITDGECNTLSRDLVVVDSSLDVLIENSTFENGRNAIIHQNNLGDLTVRFSEINNNNGYALLSENTKVTSRLQLVANNIFNNGSQPQVICQNNNNDANHNFWGAGVSATQATQGCQVENSRMLGSQIVSSPTGVQATLQSLNSTYPASDFFGFSAKSDDDVQLYVINHGSSIPFPDRAVADLTACGNFFDIFLSETSQPVNMTLRFSYAASAACEQAIQTISLCGSGSMKTFPLMWIDVKTNVTAGWDNVGDNPGGDIYPGQETRCNLQSKNIEVVLDNNGRPNLVNDLNFIPFVVGFDITAVTVLRPVEQTNGNVTVNWSTSSESNTSAFKVMRALSETGPWIQVGASMPALGGSLSGRSYLIEDNNTSPSLTYYYLLQVIANDGSIQQSIGPVRLNTTSPTNTPRPTSTTRPTSTRVPTRTPTLFRTATNSFRTFTPTFQTITLSPGVTPLITDTPTLEPFQKPTNLKSTETKRPTVNPGVILDKGETGDGNKNGILFVTGAAIIVSIVVLYLHLTRKTR